MDSPTLSLPNISESITSPALVSAKKIVFVKQDHSAGSTIIREFTHPRRAVAVEEETDVNEILMARDWPEPIGHCLVLFVAKGDEKRLEVQRWIASPDRADPLPAVAVEHDGEIIRWRPGRALVQCSPDRRNELLTLLTEFAFYEGELRAMESELAAREEQAQKDVAIAYPIKKSDQKKNWSRFIDSMKFFALMRLGYARLEPQLLKASCALPPWAERLMSALLRKADVEHRLEAVDHRLEALEDFYEGVTDRVADYRWYHHGTNLEIGIIILLVIETVIIALDLYIRRF